MPCRHTKITVLLGLSMTLLCAPARADVLVMKSTGDMGAVGAILRSGAELDVPAGGRLILLHADGRTQTVLGPVRYVSPAVANADTTLITAFAAMFRTRKDPLRLGGVRAETVAACRDENANPWIAIAQTWNKGCHSDALVRLDAALAVPEIGAVPE